MIGRPRPSFVHETGRTAITEMQIARCVLVVECIAVFLSDVVHVSNVEAERFDSLTEDA